MTLNFEDLPALAGGMLPPETYRKIHDTAAACGGGMIVEIGTAHAAATIALAHGALAGGEPFRILTVDPFGGAISSRTAFGSPADNVRIVEGNLERFGVRQYVTIVAGTVETLLGEHDVKDISLLMLDADGRIDRDLAALHDRLAPDCPIIIDDIDDALYVSRINGRKMLDQKHRISALLTNALLDSGHLHSAERLHATGFFRKGAGTANEVPGLALPAYRELVFADIGHLAPDPAPPSALRRFAKKIPLAQAVYDRLK